MENSSERFTRLWTEAQPVVSRYLIALVPDFHEAEDLLQNVAVTLLRKFPEYDESRPFVAWAIGVARIEALRHRRANARSPLHYREDLAVALANDYEELLPELDRRAAALRHCLETLPDKSGRILRLRYEEDLKPRSIAEKLGITSLVARVTLSRVREKLRQCVERRLKLEGLA